MVARIFASHSQTARDPDAATHHDRRHRLRQLAELAFYLLHLICTIVVLALVIYFIHEHSQRGNLTAFGAALAIMDIFVCLYALSRAMFRFRTGDTALAMFTLAGLWLAAIVLALRDYLRSTCRYSSPSSFDECSIRSAHIAFLLLAFLTSLIAMVIEITRWRHYLPAPVDDKASQTTAPVTATATPFPAQKTSLPAQTTSLPPQNTPFPAPKISLPPQNTPFPA